MKLSTSLIVGVVAFIMQDKKRQDYTIQLLKSFMANLGNNTNKPSYLVSNSQIVPETSLTNAKEIIMMFKELIEKSLKLPPEKMYELTDKIDHYLENKADKWELLHELDLIVQGNEFTNEVADYVVHTFINSVTQTPHVHWTKEQTTQVLHSLQGVTVSENNWYVMLNYFYNVFSGEFTEDEIIRIAKTFSNDKNAHKNRFKEFIFDTVDHLKK